MTAPQPPTRQGCTPRELSRLAYKQGAAAAFNAAPGAPDPDAAARDAFLHVLADVESRCAAAGATEEQTDVARNAATRGFFAADFPPDALAQAFACIRDRETTGTPTIGPTFLTRCRPQVYPRLFCAAVMMSYEDTGGDVFVPFPFACNAVACAYSETFGERIDPPTVQRFISAARTMQMLTIVRRGTRGPNGLPGLYRIAERWLVEKWGITDDMQLRRRWTLTAYQVRAACRCMT